MAAATMQSRAIPLRLWLWIGCVSFGGPAAQIGLLHREFVERRHWLDAAEFQRALNLCMLLPGPEALQLAIYIGWRLNGARGAWVAGLSFLGPAVIVLLCLSLVQALYGRIPVVAGALYGLEATVVALIGHALVRLARRALDTPLQWVIAIVALIALLATGLPYPLLLVAAGAAGLAARPHRVPTAFVAAPASGSIRAALATALWGAALWLLPLAALTVAGVRGLPVRVYVFMTKAALLTFGGAYAVVKYVSDDLVRVHGWITLQQSIAGLALAETTPGPLMIVLQFFGFAAGWNNPAALSPASSGTLCALLATYACFLPSFILVLMCAPQLERIAGVPWLQAALRGVTAFVVGVIASLGLTVAAAVLVRADRAGPEWPAVAITIAAAWSLGRPRIGLFWVLAGGVAAGCVVIWLRG